jgi:hypothetical protein
MRRATDNVRRPRTGDGAVLVELALILPLLTLLVLGIINLGMVIREHQVIQNAAREGARFSALPSNRMDLSLDPVGRADAIRDRVLTYLQLHFTDVSAGSATVLDPKKRYQYSISIGGTNVGTLTVDQARLMTVGGFTETASEITLTYSRTLFIPAAPFIPFNSVTLTGQSIFRNLY